MHQIALLLEVSEKGTGEGGSEKLRCEFSSAEYQLEVNGQVGRPVYVMRFNE